MNYLRKYYNLAFFSLISFILLMMGIGVFAMEQREKSDVENRYLETRVNIELSSYKTSDLTDQVEKVLKDQFYGRDRLLDYNYYLKYTFNRPFSRRHIKNITAISYPGGIIELEGGYLIKEPLTYDEKDHKTVESRAYNVFEAYSKYDGEISTYVYKPTKLEEIMDTGENCSEQYWKDYTYYFYDTVKYDRLKISSYDQYKEYFYKSDTHWKAKGAYQGYSDIISLISQDYDLDEVRPIESEYECDIEFYGNLGTQIHNVGQTDRITDYKLQGIGNYDYYENGELVADPQARKENYNSGNTLAADGSKQEDYFAYFYPVLYEKIYDFHQPDKPNALIFGDSFICENQEWIASHFNKTVIIDLRCVKEDQPFVLDEYIQKYDIDLMLVYQIYSDLYFQDYDYIPIY